MGKFSDFFKKLAEPSPEQTLEIVQESTPEPKLVGYNPNARDGDDDGLVQEGTPFERPAPVKSTKKKSK